MKKFILYLERKPIFNDRLAFVRALLAFGALLTILFNNLTEMTDFDLLIPDENTFRTVIFLKQFSIFELFNVLFAKIISVLILIFVFTGYLPQISSFLQAWVHLSICNSFLTVDGGDQIASNLSILLIPICLFDNRFNQWYSQKEILTRYRKAVNVFFNVYYFLIILQVAVIYLHSAVGKLYNDEWKDGTCIYFWFTHNVFGAPIWMQKIYNIITLSSFAPIFTWSVIIFELALFACILVTDKKIMKIFLITGLLFHFGIAITQGLITFFFSMAGALILYLDSENIIYQFLKIKIQNYENKRKT
jgi:antimicrobial peptide system SdpB family protein